jgi:hypothetical protein
MGQEERTVQGSQDRILITHVGSLPWNPSLRNLLVRRERVMWAKLRALKEGADLATRRLWG